MTYADGRLYFRYEDGTMALIGATPNEYKLYGTFKIPDVTEPSWPPPVIASGKLYLREQDVAVLLQFAIEFVVNAQKSEKVEDTRNFSRREIQWSFAQESFLTCTSTNCKNRCLESRSIARCGSSLPFDEHRN